MILSLLILNIHAQPLFRQDIGFLMLRRIPFSYSFGLRRNNENLPTTSIRKYCSNPSQQNYFPPMFLAFRKKHNDDLQSFPFSSTLQIHFDLLLETSFLLL